MKEIGLALVAMLVTYGNAGAQTVSQSHVADKQRVTLWYEAFNTKTPSLLDGLLDPGWMDIPNSPGQAAGLAGAREALLGLTSVFPDLKVTVAEILQDGDKIVVRSNITGTLNGFFLGIKPEQQRISIQAVDIHQFRAGRIVRTWHTEDWMSGLRQLGALR
jgi:predicted ester cyclase